jgi:hypothetical protein
VSDLNNKKAAKHAAEMGDFDDIRGAAFRKWTRRSSVKSYSFQRDCGMSHGWIASSSDGIRDRRFFLALSWCPRPFEIAHVGNFIKQR